jgi:AsmA protein
VTTRRIWIGIAGALLAILLLLFLAANLIDINKFRPQIQAELQAKLNRPVTLGKMSLHIFPLSLKVNGFTVGEPAGFPLNPPFIQAAQVSASASLLSLFSGKPDIHDLTLLRPEVELVENQAGAWNFSNLGSPPPPQTAQTSAVPPANQPAPTVREQSNPAAFTLNKLSIIDGQIALTNQRTKARSVYHHINLRLSNFGPQKRFTLLAEIHFPGPGKELLSFSGTAGPLPATAQEITPIEGRISIEQLSLATLHSISPDAIPASANAEISGTTSITTQNQIYHCKGDLTLTNPTIQGKSIPYPINIQYELAINRTNDQIMLQASSIKIGPTILTITGNVNAGVTPVTLALRLQTKDASLPDLLALASAFGVASNNNRIMGKLTADLTATGSVNNPVMQGTLVSPAIQAEDLALTNIHAICKMENGILQLTPITAGIYGGQENGIITLNTKAPHPLVSVNAKLTNVDVNQLLSAVSSVKNVLNGTLAAQSNVSFVLESGAHLASTLNGTLSFDVTHGHLKNVNILNELARLGKFLNASVSSGNETVLQSLSGSFNINQGVATTNNLNAKLDQGSLAAAGSLNLVNQALDLHMTAVLSSGISKAVGGTNIGGFLNTALANNKGELVLPVLVTGTMAHPVFAPDVQALAKMKINHLLPTAQNPGSLLNTLLGGVSSQQQGQKSQPPNPFNSLFKSFGKKH